MSQTQPNNSFADRIQWAMYGAVAGLVAGIILGWVFHGVVGLIVRVFVILVVLAPFIAAFIFWQKIKSRGDTPKRDSSMSDANWREIDPKR